MQEVQPLLVNLTMIGGAELGQRTIGTTEVDGAARNRVSFPIAPVLSGALHNSLHRPVAVLLCRKLGKVLLDGLDLLTQKLLVSRRVTFRIDHQPQDQYQERIVNNEHDGGPGFCSYAESPGPVHRNIPDLIASVAR